MRLLAAPLLLSALVLTACGGGTPAAPASATPPVADAPAAATGGGDYCTAVRDSLAAGEELAAGVGGSASPEVIARIRSTNDAVVASAPPELRAEIESAAGITTALADILERNGGDFGAAIDDPAFTAAVEAAGTLSQSSIEYNQRVCGVAVTGG